MLVAVHNEVVPRLPVVVSKGDGLETEYGQIGRIMEIIVKSEAARRGDKHPRARPDFAFAFENDFALPIDDGPFPTEINDLRCTQAYFYQSYFQWRFYDDFSFQGFEMGMMGNQNGQVYRLLERQTTEIDVNGARHSQ